MTLFKITCDTCRTSLNVRQKSAIGQILACPKCGSMVQVKPPEDWDAGDSKDSGEGSQRPAKRPFKKPIPDPNLPETVSTVSGSVAEGLPKTPASGKKSQEKWQGNEEGNPDQPATPSPPPAPSRKPDLPGDQWDSSKAKQRKKLLFAFSTSIAVLVFGVAAIIFAAMQFAGNNSDNNSDNKEVAKVDDDKNGKQPEKNKTKAEDKTESKKEGQQLDPDKGLSDPGKKEDKASDPKKSDDNQKTDKENTTPGTDPKKEIDDPEKTAKDSKGDSDPKKSTDDTPPGFASKDDDIDKGALPEFFRELDEFAVTFEQDQPLLKLREAFNEKDLPGSYGLSRFFVSRSLKKPPKPDLALNVPIASVSFRNTSLLEFLDFHFQLTGVPVCVDVTPVLLAGIQLDKPFDFEQENKTTRELLEELAKQLGMELINGDHSLVLTIPDRDKLVETTYPVEDLANNSQQLEQLVSQIETYINRRSWSPNGGVGIVTTNETRQAIVVKHFGWAQVRVQELLRHMRQRRDLPVRNKNANFPGGLHRLVQSDTARKKTVTLLHADPVSLSKLFAELARDSNLHVFVNWEATAEKLLPTGNLPLAVENEPFGQFINEFAEGTKLELVWHAENIVELTTQAGAFSNLTLESYDIRKAVSRTFTAEKLLKAMRNLLASNDLADFDRAELGVDLIDQSSLYAVLPQSAHLNVIKILKTAEKVGESK